MALRVLHQVGYMYCKGHGVDADYAQALPWVEKAAAQDHPAAVNQLGVMYHNGQGVTPSWRRAREYYERAISTTSTNANTNAVENMQTLTRSIQNVTSQRSTHYTRSLLVRGLTLNTSSPPFYAPAGRPPHG